jgi:SAM-dependent methyltransferase
MYTESQLQGHADLLAEKVFQTETRWPHFRLLLRNIREWARRLPEGAVVVSLERTMLYGGISLVAPFFFRQKFISVDSSPPSADDRGAYNAAMVDDPRCIRIPLTRRSPIERTGLDDDTGDLVLVPNLVHHIADQEALFAEMARITRPGGFVYVFEPTLRELHQAPDDYLRYTPFGMRNALARAGLEPGNFEVEGGPFSAIAYCWTQALQYFPESERERMERWFYGEHFRELMRWDEQNAKNLVRSHTSFPVSFSIAARKPAA